MLSAADRAGLVNILKVSLTSCMTFGTDPLFVNSRVLSCELFVWGLPYIGFQYSEVELISVDLFMSTFLAMCMP